jgi:hypothetical protein
MFAKTLAQTKMWGFWQYMFDLCHEDFSCVLGSLTAILLVFLAIVVGLGAMMTHLNKRRG